MQNRRVFQRTACRVQVVVQAGGRFLYGELCELSLSGAKVVLKKELDADRVELAPNKTLPAGMAVIPLPYDVRWKEKRGNGMIVGLQFSGGTDAFFRGWLAEHLPGAATEFSTLLDHRKSVRLASELVAEVTWDQQTDHCAILGVSVGGVSLILEREVFPGLTVEVKFRDVLSLGTFELILLHVRPLSGHFIAGGKFLEVGEAQMLKLSALVDELSKAPSDKTLDS